MQTSLQRPPPPPPDDFGEEESYDGYIEEEAIEDRS